MAAITAQLSDDLFEQLQAIAQRENLPIEQIVSQALANQVAALGNTGTKGQLETLPVGFGAGAEWGAGEIRSVVGRAFV
jgi:hypothetical protein